MNKVIIALLVAIGPCRQALAMGADREALASHLSSFGTAVSIAAAASMGVAALCIALRGKRFLAAPFAIGGFFFAWLGWRLFFS